MYGDQAAFYQAGGYTDSYWFKHMQSKGTPAPTSSVGLFHYGNFISNQERSSDNIFPFTHWEYPYLVPVDHRSFPKHFISDTIQMDGVKLYWDRSKSLWSYEADGSIVMVHKSF